LKRNCVFLLLLYIIFSTPAIGLSGDLDSIKEKESTGRLYRRAVEFFTVKVPEMFEKRLMNSEKYIDMISGIFAEKRIPVDLAYIPLVESGFSPLSVGRGNAVGLWQMVKGTATKYGLKIDTYVDERKDPLKSSYAAAEYLTDLYESFGTWDLALAAYNAGEGRIKKMFRGSESAELPPVLKSYLAKVMAASVVARNPEDYGFQPRRTGVKEQNCRNIATSKKITLAQLAEDFDTTVMEIKKRNPALLRDTTPPYPYKICLPDN
jgi:peptidoglycan lytic transglycosylase D